jgi:hypothetical protein
LAAVIRNQIKVYQGRQARAALVRLRHPAKEEPVALTNCELKRFGEDHDGGYLMCGNLLKGVRSGYSYGISGYDGWDCEVSKTLDVSVHQYDCFDTTQPTCLFGETVFHAECVGDTTETIDGRPFDTVANQLARNGDGGAEHCGRGKRGGVRGRGIQADTEGGRQRIAAERIRHFAFDLHHLTGQKSGSVQREVHLYIPGRR